MRIRLVFFVFVFFFLFFFLLFFSLEHAVAVLEVAKSALLDKAVAA